MSSDLLEHYANIFWQTNITVSQPAKKAKTDTQPESATVQVLEQMDPVSAIPNQMPLVGTNVTGGCMCYTNGNLPAELQIDRKWMKQILPALITWAGNQVDLWVIPDQSLMHALCIIITAIIPDFEDLTAIHPGTAIFSLVYCSLSV
jgi:hypothetical protein